MATINCKPTIEAFITLRLSEAEAHALDALVGYGIKPLLEVFYKHIGSSYLKPHEAGLLSLFESVRSGDASVSHFLRKAKEARSVFDGSKVAKEYPIIQRNSVTDSD